MAHHHWGEMWHGKFPYLSLVASHSWLIWKFFFPTRGFATRWGKIHTTFLLSGGMRQNWHRAQLRKRCAGVCGRSLCQFALLNQLKPNVIDMDFSLSNWLLRPAKQLLPNTISLSIGIQWQIEQKNKNVLVSFPEFFVMTKASVVNFELSSVWPRLWDLGQFLLKRNS